MIRLFSLFVTVMLFSCSTSGKEEAVINGEEKSAPAWFVTVRGKVATPQDGKIMIQEINDQGAPGWQDTITLKSDGSFSKKIRLTQPGYYKMNFYNTQVLNIILDRSDLEVNVHGSDPQGFYEVKGSPDLALIQSVQERLGAIENSDVVKKLNQEYQAATQAKDQEKVSRIYAEYMQIVGREHAQIAKMLEEHAPSLAVINLLQQNTLDKDRYFDTYVKVADKLRAQWPDYDRAKGFVEMVDKMKATAVGQLAPDIALPDPNGNIVKLSSLRGKYVLVDFWAKWCGPCRHENPNVVRVYNKFKDKGFTVYGVSLDRKKEDWLMAIEQDGLTWTHVSDLKYWQSEAAKLYNITAIPFSILVDPSGKIIDKNLRGPALERRISELLSNQ